MASRRHRLLSAVDTPSFARLGCACGLAALQWRGRRAAKRTQLAAHADRLLGRRPLWGGGLLLAGASVAPAWAGDVALASAPAVPAAPSCAPAPVLARRLWTAPVGAPVDETNFSADCLYEDLHKPFPSMTPGPAAAAGQHRKQRFGDRFVVDRISDGLEACGIVWHVEKDGEEGIEVVERGLTFVRIDQDCRVCYVREIGEPTFKAGLSPATFQQLRGSSSVPQASASASAPATSQPRLLTEGRAPRTARDMVQYLYGEAPSGQGQSVPPDLSGLFCDKVVYEDLNYEEPFVGRAAMEAFLASFRATQFRAINRVTFEVEDTSDGTRAVCFTYLIRIPGRPRGTLMTGIEAIKGVMFLEVDGDGKICYVRDIPQSSEDPAPLQLASVRKDGGGLRRFLEGGDTRLGGAGRFD